MLTREQLEQISDHIKGQPAPRQLPVIEHDNHHWFVDGRGWEIRRVDRFEEISSDGFPSELEDRREKLK